MYIISLGDQIAGGRFKANMERKNRCFQTSLGCIILCSPNIIDNGLEAWLALMLYLCSKVACFPYTFKYLSQGESTSMSRMWKYISQFKLRENCNNGNIYQPTVVELLMHLIECFLTSQQEKQKAGQGQWKDCLGI